MGKGARLRQARVGGPQRRLLVVDGLEIGTYAGTLTLRLGRDDSRPLLVALPAQMVPNFLEQLGTAARDAEEDYWNVLSVVLGKVDTTQDPLAAPRAMDRWLRTVPEWDKLVRAVPADDGAPFLVTSAGHIGFAISPPFAAEPAIAVLDPLQLQRLAPGLASASAELHMQTGGLVPWPEAVAHALRHLAAQPWPRPTPQVSPDDAAAWMVRQRGEFLRREPYVRPPENDLVLKDE